MGKIKVQKILGNLLDKLQKYYCTLMPGLMVLETSMLIAYSGMIVFNLF